MLLITSSENTELNLTHCDLLDTKERYHLIKKRLTFNWISFLKKTCGRNELKACFLTTGSNKELNSGSFAIKRIRMNLMFADYIVTIYVDCRENKVAHYVWVTRSVSAFRVRLFVCGHYRRFRLEYEKPVEVTICWTYEILNGFGLGQQAEHSLTQTSFVVKYCFLFTVSIHQHPTWINGMSVKKNVFYFFMLS